MAETVTVEAEAQAINTTSSYARVMDNKEVKERVDSVAGPIQRNYQSLIQQLRDQHAVGVVVAVNGEIVWADIFASTDFLEKYWPKLVRSYAAEAVVTRTNHREADVKQAQQFLDHLDGRHETVDSEPGLYRHTEIAGDGFRAFELTSLLPKTGFDLHVAKMAEWGLRQVSSFWFLVSSRPWDVALEIRNWKRETRNRFSASAAAVPVSPG
jgi:sulfur carrier protein ThiS